MRVGLMIALKPEIEECFRHAASLGFQSGQVSVWDMSLYCEDTLARIQKITKELNFTITALWCGWSGPVVWGYPGMYDTLGLVPVSMRWKRVEDLLRGAEFASQLGIRDVVTHIGYFPDNPNSADYREIVWCLKLICEKLAARGQRFLFETGEELPCTLMQLLGAIATDNVGVNFDPANLLMSGRANSVDALTMLSPKLMGMHGKDGRYPIYPEGKGKEMKMGTGAANYPALVQILKDIGYDGDITIERETPAGEQRDRDIAEAKAYLEGLL